MGAAEWVDGAATTQNAMAATYERRKLSDGDVGAAVGRIRGISFNEIDPNAEVDTYGPDPGHAVCAKYSEITKHVAISGKHRSVVRMLIVPCAFH